MPVFDDAKKANTRDNREGKQAGYQYVKDTHADFNHKYRYQDKDKLSNGVRWYLFKEKAGENKGRNVLHIAADNGDRDFTTMICKEAAQMGRGILQHMIDLPDEDGFSPFYLLCQKGYHPR